MKTGYLFLKRVIPLIVLTGLSETATINRSLSREKFLGIRRSIQSGPGPRIISGLEAKAEEFPWMVSLQRNGFFGRSHFCAGSIIRPDIVVTAAHCIQGLHPSAIWTVAGEHILDVVSGYEQELRGSQIIIHEDYDPGSLKNDIAIIRLAGNYTFGKFVKSAKMPNPSLSVLPGSELAVAGWGTTTEGGSLSNVLRKAKVPAISDADCREMYGEENIDETMLCAGYISGGQDSCQGDSGGQLMLPDRTLVGIVSWGYGCGQPNYPGVYTEFAYFRTWITQHLS